jgi:hypothetical protein
LSERYIPKHPTTGWMISELERLGHQRIRGSGMSDAKMATLLRAEGYDVSHKSRDNSSEKKKQDEKRTDDEPDRDFIPDQGGSQWDLFTPKG